MSKYVDNIYFVTEHCCQCGVAFAMTDRFKKQRLRDHELFYCPAGHGQYYTGKSETQKLKDKLDQTRIELEAERSCCMELKNEVKHKQKQVYGYKGQLKKLKKASKP